MKTNLANILKVGTTAESVSSTENPLVTLNTSHWTVIRTHNSELQHLQLKISVDNAFVDKERRVALN